MVPDGEYLNSAVQLAATFEGYTGAASFAK